MQEEHKEKDSRNAFDPGDYPALLEFLPAYLHEDFDEEYGSAAAAVEALLEDASVEQIRDLKGEWQLFRRSFGGRPLAEIQQALGQLGVIWQPQSEQELQALDEILRRGVIF
jgi:hypothetical protein